MHNPMLTMVDSVIDRLFVENVNQNTPASSEAIIFNFFTYINTFLVIK